MKQQGRRKPVPRRPKKRLFIRTGDFKVYILRCSDGSYYTGQTNDLCRRLELHRTGKGSRYVRSRLPFRLVYTKAFRYFRRAYAEESRIKALTRPEKELLVAQFRRDKRKKRG